MNNLGKQLKRIVSLCLAVAMLLTLCSVALADDEVVEIDFWHHYPSGTGAEIMTEVLNDFMATHPNIKVNELGLGLGVQGVKCLAQGGGAAAQAVLVVGVLQQKGVVVPGAGRQLTAVVEQRLITVIADPGKTDNELHGKNLFVG